MAKARRSENCEVNSKTKKNTFFVCFHIRKIRIGLCTLLLISEALEVAVAVQ